MRKQNKGSRSRQTNVQFNLGEYDEFFERLRQMAGGDFKRDFQLFLEGLGYEFLRLVTDEIIRRQVKITSLLMESFEKGNKNNV